MCIGPVCVPYGLLIPFVVIYFKRIWAWILIKFGFTTIEPKKEETSESTIKPCQLKTSEPTKKGENKVICINDTSEWESYVAQSKNNQTLFIVTFTARWCGPCKKISPLFHELCSQSSALFLEVSIDDEELKSIYEGRVSHLPAFHVYKGDTLIEAITSTLAGVTKLEENLKILVQKHNMVS